GILRRRGFEVTTVTTVAAAIAHIGSEPDFVLLDLMLPDGDGAHVLRQIRDANYSTRVVITTAISDPERLHDVQQLKPDAVLLKPLDLNTLLKMIEPMN